MVRDGVGQPAASPKTYDVSCSVEEEEGKVDQSTLVPWRIFMQCVFVLVKESSSRAFFST